MINSHPKDVRKFRNCLKHEEGWDDNSDKAKMRNDETNGEKENTFQTFVKDATNKEKKENENQNHACQKCENGKISHIRVNLTNQRATDKREINSFVIKGPKIYYISASEFIVSGSDLSRHFQFICESCLREEEKAKMTSRKRSHRQAKVRQAIIDTILLCQERTQSKSDKWTRSCFKWAVKTFEENRSEALKILTSYYRFMGPQLETNS